MAWRVYMLRSICFRSKTPFLFLAIALFLTFTAPASGVSHYAHSFSAAPQNRSSSALQPPPTISAPPPLASQQRTQTSVQNNRHDLNQLTPPRQSSQQASSHQGYQYSHSHAPISPPAPAPSSNYQYMPINNYNYYTGLPERKIEDFSPYFTNVHGYHGLFKTESALLPDPSTWNFGLHLKYDNYRYLNGKKNVVKGYQQFVPLHILYTGKRLFAGVTVPFQKWKVERDGISDYVTHSHLHDPTAKVGYQVWRSLDENHALTLHAEGRFSTNNYHQPLFDMSGKTKDDVRIGPAGATRGSWLQLGAAYSGDISERWVGHLNMALAKNSRDKIKKAIIRCGADYRVSRNFALASELIGESYEMNQDADGTNIDMILGFIFFNDRWQGNLGVDISLKRKWGYGHNFGVITGLQHRWY